MAGDRERIEPTEGDQRNVRRNEEGEFTDSQDDVGRGAAQDQKRESRKEVRKGQGDRGDRGK